jgi:hypothetical protein
LSPWSLVIPSGALIILSEAKDLALGNQMLGCAQHDTSGSLVILSAAKVKEPPKKLPIKMSAQ